jgi:hypothetical protein
MCGLLRCGPWWLGDDYYLGGAAGGFFAKLLAVGLPISCHIAIPDLR